MLCKLPRQGGVDREVQKLVYHGRTGVLQTQDLLLERSQARLARTLSCPHSFKEEGEELEQSWSALCWQWRTRGWTGCRSVNSTSIHHTMPPLFGVAYRSHSRRCYPKFSDFIAGPYHLLHPTDYRISITALICCPFFFSFIWTRCGCCRFTVPLP